MQEEWKQLDNYPGYQVSNMGQVASTKSGDFKLIQAHPCNSGHMRITLFKGGQRCKLAVHRLVAAAFLGEPSEGQVTRHLDGNPANNVYTNLAWGTMKENLSDSRRHGTLSIGSANGKAKLTEVLAKYAKESAKSSKAVAQELGLAECTVQRIRRGATWAHV